MPLRVEEPFDPVTRDTPNRFVITVAWSTTTGLGLGLPSPVTCASYFGVIAKPTSTQFVQRQIGTRIAIGCLTAGILGGDMPMDGRDLELIVSVATDGSARDGYVKISLNYLGPDFDGTLRRADQILNTLRIR